MNMISRMVMVAALLAMSCGAAPADAEAKKLEKARQAEAKKLAKARNDAWRALNKTAQDLMRKDFKGGYANYWHDNIDAARALYESALTNALFANEQKIAALRQAAQMHLEANRDTKAALATMDRAYKLPGLTAEDRAAADEAALSLKRAMRLAPPGPDPKAGKKSNLQTFIDYLNEGYEAYFARVPKLLAEYEKTEPKNNYWRIAWDAANQWWSNQRPTKAQRDSRFAASFVALMETAPTNHAISAEAFFAYTNGRKGLETKCRAYAEKFLAEAAKPKSKARPASVTAAKRYLTFDVGTDVRKAIAACHAWLAEEKKTGDKAALAKLFEEQARRQLRLGNEAGARELWNERLKIAPEVPHAKLDCPYWKDAPHDIRGIVEADFYKKAPKGLFVRRYGDNLKFLIETDSAITSRQMTTDKGEKFRPTELFAFCDARGVHLLIRAFLDNMDEVKAGNAGVPGYEAYLATGIDDPYHCLMFDPREGGKVEDNFVTQYDNGTGYRNLTDARGNLQYSNLYLDDSAVTLISVAWGSASASIPGRSRAWYFEAINWAHGGLSWGGSKSVHWRSNCGELKFTGVDAEALAAIQRTVVRQARQTMGAEKNARSGGYIEQWMDPVLGDQEFYLAVVKPYVARIDADLAKITKDSTPAEIAAVFATGSVDDAINITYRIADLRTKWLEEKFTK